jgi:hypothetical protein
LDIDPDHPGRDCALPSKIDVWWPEFQKNKKKAKKKGAKKRKETMSLRKK